ncbi:carbohydrate ABC transporter permease [Paenibacillus sp. FSL H7-0942]|uniref:Carbohydrate ABC transporter permease n=2 Tax=Paenibacillus TaxID=44249 RepID=A0ABD8AKA5_PAEAM|nr:MULTISPECIES: carbohydrate ABC transporter permease [Paenibacillus]APO45951.1 ABC transporter permease [Paenibacillus xylanexedens]ETT36112.1 binding-protein-dependent transport system inner membrane protein [Paenibacillus sp. FSL R5-192]ETT43826.1 binding-protein-dependent transport system inner membrane protein [Paenibacillus sp. FSL H7-689]KAA8745704.1 carbohydrate ABC transporter permease [Paenibacillus sp. UASWS1643]KLU54736.1 ABC transporter permease [Paenibacillus sp. VT-400]
MYYKTKGYRIFSIANYTFLGILSILCILPIIHILAVSFSSMAPASSNLVTFWPIGFTTDAYVKTFGNSNFINSLIVSLKRTVIATIIGMVIMLLTAFPLSKEDISFKGRSLYTWFFVFTILFSGGLIPSYILIQKLGLMNTIWALILPGALSVWNVILMMNFFRGLPKELEEAAYLDGAGHIKTLILVYVPLSLPAIATLSLFTMVYQWNSWFDGMIYMSDIKNYPLASLLQTIIVQQDLSKINVDPSMLENISQRTVRAAQIFIGALPILMVYPFLQRFFVKGIVIGAVKE